nr:hypothetical protein BN993_03619 [Virgibacillus halodenitrificans]
MFGFNTMRKRFWRSYLQARQNTSDVAPYYVVGNGVMTTRSSEVVRSGTFRKQMDASAELERQLGTK